ncbi:uncharacterized protein PHACADRAFT_202059 [Phanerochaete carnosa HHB-10118-sp]|uniref:Uncharacterized protein n=1 Tax=Phanerochaete carnosa (strain HHB-10118-sp) TaxID=650164 RepID=K5UHQ9_PHACS|nr:uncharacterized protein PHACADRAFT_202059 [Phanerochaete carnosa HHB-10118-sp]EKM49061.1 hypothetical protein PHACADRAFT_202059 [Phanerochaete carnosa HHB-10118-sp]
MSVTTKASGTPHRVRTFAFQSHLSNVTSPRFARLGSPQTLNPVSEETAIHSAQGTAVKRVTDAVPEMELTDKAADTFEDDSFDSDSTHSSMPRLAMLLEQSDFNF